MTSYPPAPRYIRLDGHWYVRKDHVAEQMEIVAESAFEDGVRCAIESINDDAPAPQQQAAEIVTQ